MPSQAMRQQLASRRQATRQRSFGDVEPARRFMPGSAFQVAEQDRNPVLLWKLAQLRVEQRQPVVARCRRLGHGLRHVVHLDFARAPSSHFAFRRQGGALGDAIEPVREQFFAGDRGGLPREHEKYGLEGILRVVNAAKDSPTNPHDHRAMPPDDQLKCPLIPPCHKRIQELAVGQPCHVAQQRLAQLKHGTLHRTRRHAITMSRCRRAILTPLLL